MVPHVHVNATGLLAILATMVVAKFLVQGIAGHHPNNPAFKAAAYVI